VAFVWAWGAQTDALASAAVGAAYAAAQCGDSALFVERCLVAVLLACGARDRTAASVSGSTSAFGGSQAAAPVAPMIVERPSLVEAWLLALCLVTGSASAGPAAATMAVTYDASNLQKATSALLWAAKTAVVVLYTVRVLPSASAAAAAGAADAGLLDATLDREFDALLEPLERRQSAFARLCMLSAGAARCHNEQAETRRAQVIAGDFGFSVSSHGCARALRESERE
jgi:hypothetical protein